MAWPASSGSQRLPARARRAHPHRRLAGRRARRAARLLDRRRGVRRGVAAVRAGAEHRGARRGARAAGDLRCAAGAELAGGDRVGLPAARARRGDRLVDGVGGDRDRDRAVSRRLADRDRLAVLAAFLRHERRTADPMLALDLFRRRNFAVGNLQTPRCTAGCRSRSSSSSCSSNRLPATTRCRPALPRCRRRSSCSSPASPRGSTTRWRAPWRALR